MWESKALDRGLGNGDRQCHQLYHFQLAMYHLAVGTVLARRDSLVQLCQGLRVGRFVVEKMKQNGSYVTLQLMRKISRSDRIT